MAALHAPTAFYAGDTWEIDGELHYADGTPFNLAAGAAVEWTMTDANGNRVLDLTLLNGGISVINPAGQCLIIVTSAQSGPVPAGKYSDRLRAVDPAGFVSTQWVGTIEVRA
jgi:hypothetical protein